MWISLYILPILVALFATIALYYLYYKSLKNYKTELRKINLEQKYKTYENLLVDSIHNKYGYVIDLNQILDSITESITSITNYTTISYLLITPKKLRFRFHMHEPVSKQYEDYIKTRILNLSLEDSNMQQQLHLEEIVSGSFIDDSVTKMPQSFIELPVLEGTKLEGYILISSYLPNQYKKVDINLIKTSISRVLTELSRLKKLVDAEKTNLEYMVDNMNSGVVLIDEDFNISAINTTALKLLNLGSKEDTTIFEIVGSFNQDIGLDEKLANVLKLNTPQVLKNVSFSDKIFDISIFPIKSSGIKKMLGLVINDMTEEKSFEQLKDDFISMAVHELRSPLTIIKGSADMLIKNSDALTIDQKATVLKQIKDSSQNLLALVNDLLDSSKIEAGKVVLNKEIADVNNLLSHIVTEFRPLVLERKLGLTLDVDIKIGNFSFDQTKIEQVLNNLISNAVKFTNEGTINVYSKLIQNGVEIGVVDTGIGIKSEQKKRIFNKYSQVKEGLKNNKHGTGLGLVIAKGIVEAHGGKIMVEDNVPNGSVFKFVLPLS